jgi:hypothetical protein
MNYPEKQIKNEISYSDFLENIEIGNIKSQLFIECTVVFFEMKSSDVSLRNQRKFYDKVTYSSRVNPKALTGLIIKLTEKGYQIEFLEPAWRKKHSVFTIYDYLRLGALLIFLIYIVVINKIKSKFISRFPPRNDNK